MPPTMLSVRGCRGSGCRANLVERTELYEQQPDDSHDANEQDARADSARDFVFPAPGYAEKRQSDSANQQRKSQHWHGKDETRHVCSDSPSNLSATGSQISLDHISPITDREVDCNVCMCLRGSLPVHGSIRAASEAGHRRVTPRVQRQHV